MALRISSISYLNTAPLMWDFERGAAGSEFEVSYTTPSSCADALRNGQADIGLIPAISYATIPGLQVIPGVAIATKGAVRSILLISKTPIEAIHAIAADAGSRTSVALARVIFRKWISKGGRGPVFTSHAPHLKEMLQDNDAALLIGDAALTAPREDYHVYDLGEEWKRRTGKPFVFAFWAVRAASVEDAGVNPRVDLAAVFQSSKRHGLQPNSLRSIARDWSRRVELDEEKIVSYLTRNVDYSLDRDNLQALELFFQYCAEIGLIPAVPRVEFYSFGAAHKRRTA